MNREITGITDEENWTLTIDRDIMGRVIKETSPTGRIVQYEWGGTGCSSCGSDLKLTKIIDSGNKTWEFKYDIMGNPIEMIYPDGSKIEQTYDLASQVCHLLCHHDWADYANSACIFSQP
jgi:YD repeat-containing protein